MSLTIADGMVVSTHYTLTDEDANVLDSTDESGPMVYLHGADNIIPGLEDALTGKTVGDRFKVRIDVEDGYGEVLTELMQVVDIAAFEGVDTVEPGMRFESENEDGEFELIVVKHVEGNKVTIDSNHPLAGMVLNFDIEVIDIREASSEEIEHEHVH
ncbi:MAG: peptidylprolyl isomerase [Gammaproteobacteria bacterium]|nr:peptidylprolyl isomerase [Gammaproteobacteria bacterium]